MLNLFALSVGAIVGIVVAAVVVLLIIIIIGWWISTRNKFVYLKNDVEEAWSTIDVYLKKRYDLIPNLVETVKGYAKHESQTLENVIKARNMAMNATGDDKIAAENMLSGTLKTLFSVVESYPQLRADAQFMSLMNDLRRIEDELSQSRRYYNAKVKAYNIKIAVFPSSIVANSLHLTKKQMFEVENEEERKNVKVSF